MKRICFLTLVTWFIASIVFPYQTVLANGSPKAVFKETSYSFGEVKQGATLVHAFSILNNGNAPLKIERVRPG